MCLNLSVRVVYERSSLVGYWSHLINCLELVSTRAGLIHKYADMGLSALWQDVKKSIKTRYPTTDIRGDGAVVVVPFSRDMRF